MVSARIITILALITANACLMKISDTKELIQLFTTQICSEAFEHYFWEQKPYSGYQYMNNWASNYPGFYQGYWNNYPSYYPTNYNQGYLNYYNPSFSNWNQEYFGSNL
ncbi:Protein of unknown function [Cotesia congregata]|uniref:Uncharacterized protein n=1 Tax=Cotesia congregata TaxID=51543 RepID=A0A8J2H9B3_COTCN|nr:Protein of unknown function [Cotesia congregata]